MRRGSKPIEDDDDKKIVRSIQVTAKIWKDFSQSNIDEFGMYKNSLVIEHLIRQYMAEKNNKKKEEEEGKDRSWI